MALLVEGVLAGAHLPAVLRLRVVAGPRPRLCPRSARGRAGAVIAPVTPVTVNWYNGKKLPTINNTIALSFVFYR